MKETVDGHHQNSNESCRNTGLSDDLLSGCVHCGFCLEVCPTYELSGDENNSPRGRLRLWRQEKTGELEANPWTVQYTDECVGCLACETACPANVPYGQLYEQMRREHVEQQRRRIPWRLRFAAWLARRPRLFNLAALPLRLLRRLHCPTSRYLFPGRPAVLLGTADYARMLCEKYRPTGPAVALLTGCLMESVFREINHATVRVLIENNFRVVVPPDQTCCGALHDHLGLGDSGRLRARNRSAFGVEGIEAVVCNSSGCGLALSHTVSSGVPVRDVLDFLADHDLVKRHRPDSGTRVYVDLPCHLVHGQKITRIDAGVLDATGYQWELAPRATDCCGSGGSYFQEQPGNAGEILRRKAEFLDGVEDERVVLASSNHVCLMQWQSARSLGVVRRSYSVRHIIQLLDPGEKGLQSR